MPFEKAGTPITANHAVMPNTEGNTNHSVDLPVSGPQESTDWKQLLQVPGLVAAIRKRFNEKAHGEFALPAAVITTVMEEYEVSGHSKTLDSVTKVFPEKGQEIQKIVDRFSKSYDPEKGFTAKGVLRAMGFDLDFLSGYNSLFR